MPKLTKSLLNVIFIAVFFIKECDNLGRKI